MNLKAGIALLLGLILGGCASGLGQPTVIDHSNTAPVEREHVPATNAALEPPPDSTLATDSLLAAAKAASSADHVETAIVHLQRGLRIDPRNVQLWVQLSAAHLADNNFEAATQHARKAIALAGQDVELTRSAWLQLATIYTAQGKLAEAKAIRRRYRSISG